MQEPRYRRTPTPGGLAAIEEGRLAPFDLEAKANLNTGVLEEYLDARGRGPAFGETRVTARLILAATAVGAAFAAVNVVVGMKVGALLAGAWYVTFLLGATQRRGAADAGAVTGAALAGSATAAGAALVLPTLFLLALSGPSSPARLAAADLPGLLLASGAVLAGGLLAVGTVAFLRRLLLVEDPLPYPGAGSYLQLLEAGSAAGARGAARARHGLRLGAAGAAAGAAWAMLRDAAVGARGSLLDALLGPFHVRGTVGMPLAAARWTWLGVALSPLLAAVGWFLRAPLALTLLAGSAFAWLVAVPLAVALDVPTGAPGYEGIRRLSFWWSLGEPSALLAWAGPVRAVGAGALIGAGLALLARHGGAVAHGLGALVALPAEAGRPHRVPARGAWETSPRLSLLLTALAAAGVVAVGYLVGGPAAAGLLVPAALLLVALLVGLAVVGESGLSPLVGMTALLLLLAFVAVLVAGASPSVALLLALLTATAYATAAATGEALLLGMKTGLYAGTRPAVQAGAAAVAIAAGSVVAAAAALALAATLPVPGTAVGATDLAAPHAAAFDAAGRLLAGAPDVAPFLLLGIVAGVGAEMLMASGGAFALGILLPFGFAVTVAAGGVARTWWERRRLARRAREMGWDAEKRAVAVVDTVLLATGLVVGEAAVALALAMI